MELTNEEINEIFLKLSKENEIEKSINKYHERLSKNNLDSHLNPYKIVCGYTYGIEKEEQEECYSSLFEGIKYL